MLFATTAAAEVISAECAQPRKARNLAQMHSVVRHHA